MDQRLRILDQIHVDSPCHESWDSMTGNEQKRFCDSCALHVLNLSAMKKNEAEDAIRSSDGGRCCVRFSRDTEGRVVTQDEQPHRDDRRGFLVSLGRKVAGLLAVGALLPGCNKIKEVVNRGGSGSGGGQPLQGSICPPPPPEPVELMGEVCIPDEELEPVPEPGAEIMGRIAAPPPEVEMGDVCLPEEDEPPR